MTTPSAPRFAGLDGLRAVAVLLVVVYHLFPGAFLRSGFVGVDVFFVISGFLITSLLLREHAASGRIALRSFWTRRARRLLPALAAVVTVSATAAWLIGGDVLVGLGRQVLGAATFSYNWLSIASGGTYFDGTEPELFRNLWSLAVEEQFYVVWPLLLPVVLLIPGRRSRVAVSVALAAASAGGAALLVAAGADVSRAYYGTDTHAFGLLLGVAAAFALSPVRRAPGRRAALATGLAGAAALVALVALAAVPGGSAAYPGVTLATSVLTVVVIAAATAPASALGRALDVQPLRWIGERSYAIYLWHWPLVVLLCLFATGSFTDAAVPVPLGVAALAATLAVSAASYRVLEQPVRRRGFAGALRAVRARLSSSPARRFGAIVAVTAGALVVGGTTAAVAAAPRITSSEAVVASGQKALDAASASPAPSSTPAATPSSTPSATPSPTAGPDGRPLPPPPAEVHGSRISAVGDSVMLASAPGLLAQFPGIQIDAKVSRSMWAAPDIVEKLSDTGKLRDYVVVGLGTNGPVDAGALQEVYDAVGPHRTLVLVNAFAPRDWIPGVNRDLAAFASAHPTVVVADWAHAIANHSDLLAGDRIHPGEAGGRVFADAVARAVDAVEGQRAQVAYQIDLVRWSTLRALGTPAG